MSVYHLLSMSVSIVVLLMPSPRALHLSVTTKCPHFPSPFVSFAFVSLGAVPGLLCCSFFPAFRLLSASKAASLFVQDARLRHNCKTDLIEASYVQQLTSNLRSPLAPLPTASVSPSLPSSLLRDLSGLHRSPRSKMAWHTSRLWTSPSAALRVPTNSLCHFTLPTLP